MRKMLWAPALVLLAAIAVAQLYVQSQAAESTDRLYDRSLLYVSTGTTDTDISAATLTSATTFLTITPAVEHALKDCRVIIDLDKATTGFNDTHTTETIQFHIGRKVDGTNWRVSHEPLFPLTAVSGTASNTRSIEIPIGVVGVDEAVRIYVTLSAETSDAEFPYVVYYRSGARATVTAVAN